jgi:phospholipid/cholesterol/gamma-HCH transport system substrate-binding protein
MDERKLEMRVGVFVLVGIAGVLGLLWLMGELRFTRAGSLEVLFSHTGNVVKGAPVKLGGVQVGRVERIALDPKRRDERGEPLPVKMGVSLDPGAREVLHTDAQVTVSTVGPLGEAYLELYPGTVQAPPLPAGEAIRGTDAPRLDLVALRLSSFLDASSRLLDKNPEAIASFLTGVTGLTHDLDTVVAENREDLRALTSELAKASKGLGPLLSDAQVTARSMRENVPPLSGDARRVFARFAQLSDQFTEEDAKRLKLAIERYSAAGEKLDQLAARGERILGRIEAGEGTLGKLQKDPALYEDVKSLVEDLRKHPWKILWKD